ncbi:MAG: chromosome partitioning protein [Saprospiraceae bacterium]|jgi:chromosome partitioning protein
MIISVTSLKGGVGKSTISQNLAVCFAQMGYKTAIVDTDTNGSSIHWSGLRDESLPEITVLGLTDSDALRKNIKRIHNDYDIIVIDGTPSISKLVSTILVLGDIVLIPIRPSGFDIWATEKFIETYEQAKTLKEDMQAFFVINEFNPRANLNIEIREALKELKIETLKTTFRTRIAYGEASVLGLGAYEYKDLKAKEEATNLSNEVLNVLKNL